MEWAALAMLFRLAFHLEGKVFLRSEILAHLFPDRRQKRNHVWWPLQRHQFFCHRDLPLTVAERKTDHNPKDHDALFDNATNVFLSRPTPQGNYQKIAAFTVRTIIIISWRAQR